MTGLETMVLNRLADIDRAISDERKDSATSRQRVYEKLDGVDDKLNSMDRRVEKLEVALSSINPTVAEFLTYKANVEGARMLGRFLWVTGGVILGFASSTVIAIASGWSFIERLWKH